MKGITKILDYTPAVDWRWFWNQKCNHCHERTIHRSYSWPDKPAIVQCVGCRTVWIFEGKAKEAWWRRDSAQLRLIEKLKMANQSRG